MPDEPNRFIKLYTDRLPEIEEDIGVLGKPIEKPIVLNDPARRQLGHLSIDEETSGVFFPD